MLTSEGAFLGSKSSLCTWFRYFLSNELRDTFYNKQKWTFNFSAICIVECHLVKFIRWERLKLLTLISCHLYQTLLHRGYHIYLKTGCWNIVCFYVASRLLLISLWLLIVLCCMTGKSICQMFWRNRTDQLVWNFWILYRIIIYVNLNFI